MEKRLAESQTALHENAVNLTKGEVCDSSSRQANPLTESGINLFESRATLNLAVVSEFAVA